MHANKRFEHHGRHSFVDSSLRVCVGVGVGAYALLSLSWRRRRSSQVGAHVCSRWLRRRKQVAKIQKRLRDQNVGSRKIKSDNGACVDSLMCDLGTRPPQPITAPGFLSDQLITITGPEPVRGESACYSTTRDHHHALGVVSCAAEMNASGGLPGSQSSRLGTRAGLAAVSIVLSDLLSCQNLVLSLSE